jgi:hypothetical protein
MHTTTLRVMVATLSLLALGLGPGAPRARAQERTVSALRYSATLGLESETLDTDADTDAGQRRAQLGLGIAGLVTGAIGLVVGGPVLLIAGTTRTHCTGSLWSGTRSCAPAPDDTGDLVGGVLSMALGAVAMVTGVVLIADRPRRPNPRLAFGADSTSVSFAVSGSF